MGGQRSPLRPWPPTGDRSAHRAGARVRPHRHAVAERGAIGTTRLRNGPPDDSRVPGADPRVGVIAVCADDSRIHAGALWAGPLPSPEPRKGSGADGWLPARRKPGSPWPPNGQPGKDPPRHRSGLRSCRQTAPVRIRRGVQPQRGLRSLARGRLPPEAIPSRGWVRTLWYSFRCCHRPTGRARPPLRRASAWWMAECPSACGIWRPCAAPRDSRACSAPPPALHRRGGHPPAQRSPAAHPSRSGRAQRTR